MLGVVRHLHAAHAGHHAHEGLHRAHLLHLLHLREEVLQVEVRLAHLFRHALGVRLIDILLRLLHERNDVAHAEDARDEPVRIKDLEVLRLLAGADELDRHTRDRLDGQRRAAARIAVELGEDQAGETEGVVKRLGDIHRLLPERAVGDEEDFIGLHRRLEALHFLDQPGVNLQATGRVEKDDVGVLLQREIECL